MGENDQISSQGFGYGKREECKKLMVFGSHNKILSTLSSECFTVLIVGIMNIYMGKRLEQQVIQITNFSLVWAICGCEISRNSRKESQLLFEDCHMSNSWMPNWHWWVRNSIFQYQQLWTESPTQIQPRPQMQDIKQNIQSNLIMK